MQRLLLGGAIQAKLTVNTPNDEYELEADRVADHVMRMSIGGTGEPPFIQRTCTSCSNEMESAGIQRMCKGCDEELRRKEVSSTPLEISTAGESPGIQRMCGECDEKLRHKEQTSTASEISTAGDSQSIQRMCGKCDDEVKRKERSNVASEISSAVESQILALQGRGEPLPQQARSFFESRFGRDFRNVRVHVDGPAADTAQSVNALAYTRGSHIVFARGQYQPGTPGGRRLLAHELTHVVQQGRASSATIQRECNDDVPSTPGCSPDPTITPPATKFLFDVNCDAFATGQETALELFAGRIAPTATVRVVGLASSDGSVDLNNRLSCSRAQKGASVVRRSVPTGVTISSVDATGGIPGTANDSTMRAVGLEVSTPPPARPTPSPTPPTPPPTVKPGPRTPCERDCAFDFDDCLARSTNPLNCIARQQSCFQRCAGSPPAFEVCVRLLQPPVEISGCNHAYIETPTRRYAIITPCTSQLSFADPIFGGVALKTDRSPDPCRRRPTCVECIPKPGVTDLERCFETEFRSYAAPSLHKILGPNSNTFAGTLARACCDNMVPKPAAFGCVPGWDDPPAPSRTAPCPTGPPVC